MKIEYAQERFADAIDEARPLLVRHWTEVARNKEAVPLDPNYDRYIKMEEMGLIRVYTARHMGAMVGYACYFVLPHLHYQQDLWAVSDILWLAPECRKGFAGIGLLRFVEQSLREEKVSVMHTTGKVEHPALLAILERLGHKHIEFGCAKLLKRR